LVRQREGEETTKRSVLKKIGKKKKALTHPMRKRSISAKEGLT